MVIYGQSMDNIWIICGLYMVIWLVVWNMLLSFHSVGNGTIIPTDELIFCQRGRYTTNQYVQIGRLVSAVNMANVKCSLFQHYFGWFSMI